MEKFSEIYVESDESKNKNIDSIKLKVSEIL
jgi:hypothetical protein